MKNKEIEELLNNFQEVLDNPTTTDECYDGRIIEIDRSYDLEQDEIKLLLSYIEQLQTNVKDCKQKLEQYENPDDLTLFYMWLDTKAQDKMKQLENKCESLLEDRKELLNAVNILQNNRDKALEYIEKHNFMSDWGSCIFGEANLYDIIKGDSDDTR